MNKKQMNEKGINSEKNRWMIKKWMENPTESTNKRTKKIMKISIRTTQYVNTNKWTNKADWNNKHINEEKTATYIYERKIADEQQNTDVWKIHMNETK